MDLIKKSRVANDLGNREGLTPVDILALSELMRKPELNLHAEYLASLK